MKGLRFLDFDLLLQPTSKGYRAQVLASPCGQASAEFALPFSDLEIENFLLRLGRTRQPTRRLGTSHFEEARDFGGRLFEAAFNGEVRSCLRSSLDEAQRLEAGLRIRLRLADAPALNDLPWEFLLYPALDRFLALSAETPLVRYLDHPERIRPLAVKPPLEVLAVISSPTDYPSLDVESEWRQLQESLAELQARGLLVLSRLESPTLSHLQRWLRRQSCHILHFIGHGGFNPKTEEGLLLFSDENGRGDEVAGQTLGTLLHDHRPLRLAVLNACEGARTSRSDPFAGVAQSLIRQGIPAVVAMQFEISDKAAITFASELYAAVVDGYPIDAALGEARKALFFAGHSLEWGTPVLYMRSPDGRIFDVETPAEPVKAKVATREPKTRILVTDPPPAEKAPLPAPKPPPPQPRTPPAIAERPTEIKTETKAPRTAVRRMAILGLVVSCLLLLVIFGPRIFHKSDTSEPPEAPAPTYASLRTDLEASYEVLSVPNGVLLKPRKERAGIRTIEVVGNTILINEEPVGEPILRTWLGDQAELVLRLSRVPPARRQAVLGLENVAQTDEPPSPPEAPAPTYAGLRTDLEAIYEIFPVPNGVLLKPRKEHMGVRTIEVAGDTILINGELVSERTSRDWLGDRAELVLRFSRVPPAKRQAVLGLDRK